jgi:hypothetical protein
MQMELFEIIILNYRLDQDLNYRLSRRRASMLPTSPNNVNLQGSKILSLLYVHANTKFTKLSIMLMESIT